MSDKMENGKGESWGMRYPLPLIALLSLGSLIMYTMRSECCPRLSLELALRSVHFDNRSPILARSSLLAPRSLFRTHIPPHTHTHTRLCILACPTAVSSSTSAHCIAYTTASTIVCVVVRVHGGDCGVGALRGGCWVFLKESVANLENHAAWQPCHPAWASHRTPPHVPHLSGRVTHALDVSVED